MSTTTIPSMLGQRVYDVLASENDPQSIGHGFPAVPAGEYLSMFELDCRDWGITYGIAYGIARGEDPYESVASVAGRALEAAKEAYARWSGDEALTEIGFLKSRAGERPKSMREALKPVMDAYERAVVAGGGKAAMPDDFRAELLKLDGASR